MEKFQTSFYTEVDVRSDVVVCTEEEVTSEDEARSILRDGSCYAVDALRRARSRTEEELSTDIGREAIRATEVVFETKPEGEDVALLRGFIDGVSLLLRTGAVVQTQRKSQGDVVLKEVAALDETVDIFPYKCDIEGLSAKVDKKYYLKNV